MRATRACAGSAAALAIAVLALPLIASAQSASYAVQVSATVSAQPPQIVLTWGQDTAAVPLSYTVYRKAPGATSWGTGTVLPGTTTSYTDTNVVVGTAYEFQVVKTTSTLKGFGYIQAGIEIPLVDSRGKLVLIVDNTMAAPLATELAQLQQDLAGDGWSVVRYDVGRNDPVTSVKALITSTYGADPANVKAVFLFGRIPVPYSGRMAPDGHVDHIGAWPADAYYGDMDGVWTDSWMNYVQTANGDANERARLTNVPGDGKFDQTGIPAAMKLQVGRVDFARMPGRVGGVPTFASEQELLRQYLRKSHAFRHRQTNVQRRAVVGDYFGPMNGEAFAASGFRSFAPLVGRQNIADLNALYGGAGGVWIPTLAKNDYLLAYGCGGGTYTSIAGIGSTTDIVQQNVRAVFSLVCGSYLGDWDSEDNIMRSLLATADGGLAAVWSGRPHWYLHPMGLGETIGYAARLTQNAWGVYSNQLMSGTGLAHIALMGDPALRLLPVSPVGAFAGSLDGTTATLSWAASPEASHGYHVYRATSSAGPFTRVTTAPVTGTTFVDRSATTGLTYMVRAVKLEVTPSGSYYNASQGLIWSTGGTLPASTSTTTASSGSITTTSTSPTTSVVSISTTTTTITTTSVTAPAPVATNAYGDAVWFDDALPAGAVVFATGGDSWNWVTGKPAAFSGTKAHQSNLAAGLHEHGFSGARATLAVRAGDTLFVHVYLDPANVPSQLMLTWQADNAEHRAYWGINKIDAGKPGTASRRFMGKIPAAGQWVLLEIPAREVGLEGQVVTGMTFSLYDGRATWDFAGKIGARK